MVPTTRSQIRNDNTDRTPAAASVNNNPITTQYIIMVQTAAEAAAFNAGVASAVATATGVAPVGPVPPVVPVPVVPTYVLGSKLCDADVDFFKDKDNMNCNNNDAVAGLAGEGIAIPEDLVNFEDDDIDNMARNLSKATPNPV
jgi:hypothetical protein